MTPSGIFDFENVGYSSARDLEIPSIPQASRAKAEQIHQCQAGHDASVPSCGYTGLREPTAKVRYGMNIKLPCTTPAADDEQTKTL